MIKRLSCMAIFLLSTSVCFAISTAKPEMCPSVASFAAVESDFLSKGRRLNEWSVGFYSSPLDTNQNWSFVMGPMYARNEDEAKSKYSMNLPTLKKISGPKIDDWSGKWICVYTTMSGGDGYAYTPEFPRLRAHQ